MPNQLSTTLPGSRWRPNGTRIPPVFIFLFFTGAALISTVALFFRQPLLVAYIVLGVILGPFGLEYIADASLLSDIAEFGTLFLLFLLGLDIKPIKLLGTLKKRSS